jgi:hypothetical protein
MNDIFLGKDVSVLKEKNQEIKEIYHMVEVFFMKKTREFEVNENASVDSILADAPSYYSIVHFLERFYIAITKDKD